MLGIIIQARLGSTRLPRKLITPFYNEKGIFELLIEKIKSELPGIKIVVATTKSKQDDELIEICKKYKIEFYRGSEENVLVRFIKTAENFGLEKVIRICADNPFLNINALKDLLKISETSNEDYVSYKTHSGKPSILTHYGLWSEMVTLNALKRIHEYTNEKVYLEHVTNFIYTHGTLFKIKWIPISEKSDRHKNVRMTLDTIEDFILLKEIYNQIPHFSGTTLELIDYVVKNDKWLNTMETAILKNIK